MGSKPGFFDLGFKDAYSRVELPEEPYLDVGKLGGVPHGGVAEGAEIYRVMGQEPEAAEYKHRVSRSSSGFRVLVVIMLAALTMAAWLFLLREKPPEHYYLFVQRTPAVQPAPDVPPATPWSPSPAVLLALTLIGVVVVVFLLSFLVHFLRERKNPLYWEVACWVLVVVGIIARQLIAGKTAEVSLVMIAVSAAIGMAVLPGLMRWLNRIPRTPGLMHVAVPFSLGFFIDTAQVLASHFGAPLPWVKV